ncbi:hypothetical protein GCM10022226_77630 [Sphaerisporangium flaviroseum]|uniref:DUF2914 domain-containing protein n=1 Tax=Sphaerisporangium flaviroseum TaxID=509199 RepID=A0ABP7JGR0_9ACTN
MNPSPSSQDKPSRPGTGVKVVRTWGGSTYPSAQDHTTAGPLRSEGGRVYTGQFDVSEPMALGDWRVRVAF